MNGTTEHFFSADEKKRIEAAVKEAEKRTSGEIVPMVAASAYDYPRAEIVGGGFFALATAVLLSWTWGNGSLWVFLPAFLLLYLPSKWLVRFCTLLKRSLVTDGEMAEEVMEKAMVSFVERELHHTRDHTGILILVCLFERRVQVLADGGINAVVPAHTWDDIVAAITAGLRDGRACDALCQAVTSCGDLLAEHFPVRHDDRDELPNLILD